MKSRLSTPHIGCLGHDRPHVSLRGEKRVDYLALDVLLTSPHVNCVRPINLLFFLLSLPMEHFKVAFSNVSVSSFHPFS